MLVLAAILMLVLIGILGLSLDVAHVRMSFQESQAAADAASLAAAGQVLDDDPATDFALTRNAALRVALLNKVAGAAVRLDANWGNAPDGDIVIGSWDRIAQTFEPYSVTTHVGPAHNAVLVRAQRTASSAGGSLALYFGPAFGAPTSEVSRSAIAVRSGDWGPGVLVLHPTMSGAFDLRGRAEIQVPKDSIQVNSSHAQALKVTGTPNVRRIVARHVDVHGGYQIPSGTSFPTPSAGAEVVPDPLVALPYPDKSTMPNRGRINHAGNFSPGWYPGGVDFDTGTAHLVAGIYVFGAQGITLRGSALLEGDRVMLFIDQGARVSVTGNTAGLVLSPPPSDTYEGVVLFQHRTNSLACTLTGNGTLELKGTLYLPGALLEMDGTVPRKLGRVIVDRLLIRGQSSYLVTGIGHPPQGPKTSFLVE